MHKPASAHFTVAACLIVGVTLATALLQHLGLLERFETTGIDAFSVFQTRPISSDILIVAITEDDYAAKALFDATSPLRCDAVKKILDAVAASKPLVIGVDLDTADRRFACLADNKPRVPVVWAEDATWDAAHDRFTPVAPLGGHGPTVAGESAGIAVLPQDSDGTVRRYNRSVPADDGRLVPTFPWAIMQAACRAGCDRCCHTTTSGAPSSGDLRLNFSGDRFAFMTISAGTLLSAVTTPGWREGNLLGGKIVLLGGTYREGRDVQFTPVGPRPGVEILAQAIESELQGRGIRPINTWLALALDLFIGFLLVYVNYRLRGRLGLALIISLLLIPLLCFLGSYTAFSTLAFWFNFTPVVLSVMLHQLFEHGREYQRLRAQQEEHGDAQSDRHVSRHRRPKHRHSKG